MTTTQDETLLPENDNVPCIFAAHALIAKRIGCRDPQQSIMATADFYEGLGHFEFANDMRAQISGGVRTLKSALHL